MQVRYKLVLGIAVGITLVLSGCDQQPRQSTYSKEYVVVKDNMGRTVREHRDGYVTIYKYPTEGDRRIPKSVVTVRE